MNTRTTITRLSLILAIGAALSACQSPDRTPEPQVVPAGPAGEADSVAPAADPVSPQVPAPASAPVAADAPKPAAAAHAPGNRATYAQVVSVAPVRRSVDNPHEVCRDVEVSYQVAPKDEHKIAGTAIGAIVGGAVGHQIGDGSGRDVAKVAGALAGAAAGRKIQAQQQAKNTQTRVERQCETVNDPTYETVAYDIVYEYAGQTHTARVAEDPGERIKLPVRSLEE